MNKYQYTPKEWRSEYCGKDRIRISKISDKRRIATIAVKSRIMDEANARLIAAAPELLVALKAIKASLNQPVQHTGIRNGASCDILRGDARTAVEFASAAIAKAEG